MVRRRSQLHADVQRSRGEWLRFGSVLAACMLAAAVSRVGADAPADRYTSSASQGLVTDLRTGLVWQQTPNNLLYTWDQASTLCRFMALGLMGGFRLPTLKELLTIVDPIRVRPAVDLKAFPNTPAEWFWTSSTRHSAGPAAVSFETGGSSYFATGDSLRVRCVR